MLSTLGAQYISLWRTSTVPKVQSQLYLSMNPLYIRVTNMISICQCYYGSRRPWTI